MKLNFEKIANYPAPLRLGIFLLTLVLIWLPFAAPIYLLLNNDPNLVTILTMGLLFILFLILLPRWGKYVHKQPQIIQTYGLVRSRKNAIDFFNGLSIGLVFSLSLFATEAIFGWIEIKTPSVMLLKVIAEGLLSAIGVGFAEELVFRGWILDELRRDYQIKTVSWANALVFAVSHFIKPIDEVIRTFVTFPALVILGLSLVWAKGAYRDRLGICIGLHAGLVWGYYILNIGKLIENRDRAPDWVTGIDGNPIAGLMGLFFLGILAIWMRKKRLAIK
ncbi:MAG: lysostaphin resistance A-like protein [Xenococcaceae cyanobacterium]